MRENVELDKCAHVAFQSVLMKPTATSMPVSNVGLHAAAVTRGGPPELPGFECKVAGGDR